MADREAQIKALLKERKAVMSQLQLVKKAGEQVDELMNASNYREVDPNTEVRVPISRLLSSSADLSELVFELDGSQWKIVGPVDGKIHLQKVPNPTSTAGETLEAALRVHAG